MKKIILGLLFVLTFSLSGCDLIPQDIIDEFAPQITGTEDIEIAYGTEFDIMAGVNLASDYTDSTVTYEVKDSEGNIVTFDTTVPMVYYVTYTVTSNESGESKTFEREVTVLPEVTTSIPVLNGDFTQVTYGRSVFGTINVLEGISATDEIDGNITDQIEYKLYINDQEVSEVPTDYIGEVKVVFSVTNSSNETVTEDLVITIIDDAQTSDTDPIISNTNNETLLRSEFDNYNPLSGVTASDEEDGDLTSALVVTILIDDVVVTVVPADYIGEVEYQIAVTDSDTNTVSVSIIVTIEADPVEDVPPTIIGNVNQTILRSQVATFDFLNGVSASDEEDGDLTSAITVAYFIDEVEVTEIPADYIGDVKVVYTVEDSMNQLDVKEAIITIEADPVVEIPDDIEEQFQWAAYTTDFLFWLIMGQTPDEICEYIDYVYETNPSTDECLATLNGFVALGYTDVQFGDYEFIAMEGESYLVEAQVLLYDSEMYPTPITVLTKGTFDEYGYLMWEIRELETITALNTRTVVATKEEAKAMINDFYDALFYNAQTTADGFCSYYHNMDASLVTLSDTDCTSLFNAAHLKDKGVTIKDIHFVLEKDGVPEHYIVELSFVYDFANYTVEVEFFFEEVNQEIVLGSIFMYSSLEYSSLEHPITSIELDEDYINELLYDFYDKFTDPNYDIEDFCEEYVVPGFTHDCQAMKFYRSLLAFNDIYPGYAIQYPDNAYLYYFTLYNDSNFVNSFMDVGFLQKADGSYGIYIDGHVLGSDDDNVRNFEYPYLVTVWNNDNQMFNNDEILDEYLTDFFDDTLSTALFNEKYSSQYSIYTNAEMVEMRQAFAGYTYYGFDLGPSYGTDYETIQVFGLSDGTDYVAGRIEYTILDVNGTIYFILRDVIELVE